MEPIDIDDIGSWPLATRSWAERRAERLAGSTEYVLDLAITLEQEDELRQTFGARKLVAYHCTRLLPSERAAILATGLRVLDKGLVMERIQNATSSGGISEAIRQEALANNVFAIENEAHRAGRVCLVIGRTVFDEPGGGCDPLLRYWGGEAIRGGPRDAPELELIGKSAIVVACLNMTRAHNDPHSFPPLAKLFVGLLLGLSDVAAEVHYRESIPADDILAVWQPGDAQYDRHPELPV